MSRNSYSGPRKHILVEKHPHRKGWVRIWTWKGNGIKRLDDRKVHSARRY